MTLLYKNKDIHYIFYKIDLKFHGFQDTYNCGLEGFRLDLKLAEKSILKKYPKFEGSKLLTFGIKVFFKKDI